VPPQFRRFFEGNITNPLIDCAVICATLSANAAQLWTGVVPPALAVIHHASYVLRHRVLGPACLVRYKRCDISNLHQFLSQVAQLLERTLLHGHDSELQLSGSRLPLLNVSLPLAQDSVSLVFYGKGSCSPLVRPVSSCCSIEQGVSTIPVYKSFLSISIGNFHKQQEMQFSYVIVLLCPSFPRLLRKEH